MAEGRMPDIVDQRQRLGKIDVQVELRSNGARDLRDLDGVGQAGAKVVGVAAGEDLRLVFETAESAGVDDAIAVTLERIAIRMRRLGIAASAGILDADGVRSEHRRSLAAVMLSSPVRRGSSGLKAASENETHSITAHLKVRPFKTTS